MGVRSERALLPLIGLTAAATFLANWRIPFMVVGLLTNLAGIALMVRELRRRRTLPLQSLAGNATVQV